ncbi:MAG: co-chaperone GroES [Bacteroidales bacterium]|nr:co-chaperone GroES [Bacteroidales bacterium]HPD96299.1 co-chaperone GroES [Tenuifilaceae bacterium]HRX31378.1 co-chaperone GroES [Tenuifilaceae bacterium]
MKELVPLNQHVILDLNEDLNPSTTASGIIIPDTVKEKPQWAKVIAVGNVENAEISINDMVVFKKFSGTEVEFEGKKYLLIPYADLLAKVVETEEI